LGLQLHPIQLFEEQRDVQSAAAKYDWVRKYHVLSV
jgi:hypothetical protein